MLKSKFLPHLSELKNLKIEQKAFVLLLIKRRTFFETPAHAQIYLEFCCFLWWWSSIELILVRQGFHENPKYFLIIEVAGANLATGCSALSYTHGIRYFSDRYLEMHRSRILSVRMVSWLPQNDLFWDAYHYNLWQENQERNSGRL